MPTAAGRQHEKAAGAHRPAQTPNIGTYQPTFLYEAIWDAGAAGVVVWAERRFHVGAGRAFALHVALYTLGRGWIEYLRVDHANHLLGLRLNRLDLADRARRRPAVPLPTQARTF